MITFDREKERQILLGDVGYMFCLARDIDQSKAVGGRGSSAHAFLGTAVRCILNGFSDPALQLLEKARQWVTLALAEREIPKRYINDERYAPEGEAALRYHTLALCNWLLTDRHDADSYKQFVQHEDAFLAKSPAGKDKVNVSLTLPMYVDAGVHERVADLFTSTGLRPPKSLDSIRNEGQMSYVLALHHLGREYADSAVRSATRRFLDRNVNNWLVDGHSVKAAEWMKIVYWEEGKVSAKDALLKCYEHLEK